MDEIDQNMLSDFSCCRYYFQFLKRLYHTEPLIDAIYFKSIAHNITQYFNLKLKLEIVTIHIGKTECLILANIDIDIYL